MLFTKTDSGPFKQTKGYVHKGANLAPFGAKICAFLPISSNWFIKRITQVQNSGFYLNLIVAIVTKMADK